MHVIGRSQLHMCGRLVVVFSTADWMAVLLAVVGGGKR